MSRIGKKELTDTVAKVSGVSKAAAASVIDALLTEVSSALVAGCEVQLAGVGILTPATRSARAGRNPSTGEAVAVPEQHTVRFKASSTLKAALN